MTEERDENNVKTEANPDTARKFSVQFLIRKLITAYFLNIQPYTSTYESAITNLI